MAVDDLRENFHINKIAPSELQDFLTAQTYRPDITISYQKIFELRNKTLQQLCASKIQQGSTPVYSNIGPVCLKSKQVGEIVVSDFTDTCVDEKWAKRNLKSKVSTGDVLLTRQGTGTIGRAGLYLGAGAYTNDSLFKISIDKADSAYVCAFLSTFIGHRLIEKGVYGSTGQLNLSVEHVKRLPVPVFDQQSQKYIGDKVRQAEQLRAWAKRLEQASSNLFADALGQLGYKKKESNKIVRATLEDRLDPAFYDEKYSFFNEPWFIENSQPLKLFIEDGSYGVLPSSSSYGKGGVKFIRATDLKNANIDPACFTYVPEDEVVSKAKVSEGDILMEIKGAISSCELADAHLAGAYVNGSIFRFTTKGINNAYLTYFLSSLIKELYCERVSVNNIISYLDLASIHSLPVVRFENHIEELLARNLIKINSAKKYAFSLTQCAKTLVEALIEGQLTEQQLIQAHQALEDGDNGLDRAILSKLSNAGYGIEGATPLFNDVDELYRLLESAAQAEAEE